MTVKRLWWLICDGCGTTQDEPFNNFVHVDQALKQVGWFRIRKAAGHVRHYCPACHERNLGGPGNLFV